MIPMMPFVLNDSIQLIGAGAASYTYTGMVVDQNQFLSSQILICTQLLETDGKWMYEYGLLSLLR